jgi:hypothetical protein
MKYCLSTIAIFGLVFIFSCGPSAEEYNTSDSAILSESSNSVPSSDVEQAGETTPAASYEDGTFCADVDFYNPNTGTRNSYTLNVEIENGEVTKILWPNGGWLDDDHFTPEALDDNNQCSFETDRGYQYDIEVKGDECDFSNANMTLLQCTKALGFTEKELSNYEKEFKANRNELISEEMCEALAEYKHATDSILKEMKKLNSMVENGFIQTVKKYSKQGEITCQLAIVKKNKMYYLMRIFGKTECDMGTMEFNHKSLDVQIVAVQQNPNINRKAGYQAQILTQSFSIDELENQYSNYCSF